MKLTKEIKGMHRVYRLMDGGGNIVAERISRNDYIACTADGSEFYMTERATSKAKGKVIYL